MYIYNEEKIKNVKEILKLNDCSDDKMCEIIFNKLRDVKAFKEYFTYINEGSDRAAYRLKETDIVIKINLSLPNYNDGLCFQGAIEKEMYEKYKDNDLCYEIYGISDNYSIIFCEYLDTDFSPLNLLNLNSLDLYYYVIEEMDAGEVENIDEFEFYEMLSYIIEEFLNKHYDNVFKDVHIDNVGLDKDGQIKILDLGYGDGEIASLLAETFLLEDNNKIYGLYGFNSTKVEEKIVQFGGYHNEIVA